ncbi:MAG: hypothetical protein QMB94_14550, partial [Phycisphaerales bacterium]
MNDARPNSNHFQKLIDRGVPRTSAARVRIDRAFSIICLGITLIAVLALALLLASILIEGFPGLSWSFIERYASRIPEQA